MHVALLASNWVSAFSPLVMIPPVHAGFGNNYPGAYVAEKTPQNKCELYCTLYACFSFFLIFLEIAASFTAKGCYSVAKETQDMSVIGSAVSRQHILTQTHTHTHAET